jgi:transposase InsO family protein
MSTEEKVELVSSTREECGLVAALAAIELPKSTWYYHRNHKISYQEKYAHIRPLLEKIAKQHPSYGIPRITKELREEYNQIINHKVVQRMLQQWDLSLRRNVRAPEPGGVQRAITAAGKRANLVAQMEQIGLFAVLYTDFTELLYADGTRKAYLMPVIGHTSKLTFGWAVGPSANTNLALQVWEQTKETFQQLSVPQKGVIVHHDQDSVYTGYGWSNQVLVEDEARLSYALNGAKDNPEMEAFNGRFKSENHSLFLDAQNIAELRKIVAQQMHYYNTERRHSSLDYISPQAFIEQQHASK